MANRLTISKKAFTVLELLVAVSVTALLAGMLLNITSQVMKTQTEASGDLETNQVAQFVLDRIQETCSVQYIKMMEMFGWRLIFLNLQTIVAIGQKHKKLNP